MIDNIKILSELKSHLIKNYGESVNDVILFGSQILGNSNEYSDYDVLIVLENDYSGKDENQILDLCYDIDLKYNIFLDVHLISIKELTSVRGRQAVFVNAIKSGIHAWQLIKTIANQYETSKHAQLIGWFNKNFINQGLIDSKYGKIINKALNRRTKGDYDTYVEFEKEIVIEMFAEMQDFISEIRSYLKIH